MTAVNGELQDRPPFNNEAAAPVPPVPTPEPATAGQVTCNRKCKGKNMAEPGRKGCRKCLDYDKAIRKTPKTNKNDGSLAGGNNAAAAATQTPAGPSHSPLGGNPDQITASSTSPVAGHQRMQVSPASPYSLQHVGGVGPQVPRGTDTAAGAGQSFFGHRNQISGSPMPPIMYRHTIHASPVSRNVAQPAGDVFSHGLPGTHDFAGARESFFGNRNRILGSPMSPIPYHHTIHAAPAFRDLAQPPVDSFAHGLPGTHDAAGTRESLFGRHHQPRGSPTNPTAGHHRMHVSPASPNSLQPVGGVGSQVPRGIHTADGAGQSFFGHRNQISGSPMPPIVYRHTIHASPTSSNVAQPTGDVFAHGLPSTHDAASARESFLGRRHQTLGSPMFPIGPHGNRQGPQTSSRDAAPGHSAAPNAVGGENSVGSLDDTRAGAQDSDAGQSRTGASATLQTRDTSRADIEQAIEATGLGVGQRAAWRIGSINEEDFFGSQHHHQLRETFPNLADEMLLDMWFIAVMLCRSPFGFE
jgi:hypothetical protein